MKVSFLEKLTLYRDVYVALIRKENRSQEKVEEDYEKGLYQKYVDSKIWSQDLTDISIIGLTDPIRLKENKLSYYRYNQEILKDSYMNIWKQWETEFVETFGKFIDEKDEIVELGCGYGKNLFALRRNNFKNKMIGNDISKNAIIIAKKLNEKFNSNIEFTTLDMTSNYSKDIIENKTVFTYGALEQTKYQLEIILKKLIDSNPKQIIHFETLPRLLPNNLFGISVRANRFRKDYQTKILQILEKYGDKVSISNLEKVKTCPSVFNPMMMVRYKII